MVDDRALVLNATHPPSYLVGRLRHSLSNHPWARSNLAKPLSSPSTLTAGHHQLHWDSAYYLDTYFTLFFLTIWAYLSIAVVLRFTRLLPRPSVLLVGICMAVLSVMMFFKFLAYALAAITMFSSFLLGGLGLGLTKPRRG